MDLTQILNKQEIQAIINEPDFYFQKGADVLKNWMQLTVPDTLKNDLLSLSEDYRKLQAEAVSRQDINSVLQLLYEVISYCDTNAKEKHNYNKYKDTRTLAMANVRMGHWVRKLLLFKFSPDKLEKGSPRNAFEYLLDPSNNTTILSENHRKLISENLLNKDYSPESFVKDLKDHFANQNLNTSNPANYTQLLSALIYEIENDWKEEVVALMASDKTDWKDEHIKKREGYEYSIIWNSARPVGREKTLNALRDIIKERGSFNLYYSSLGSVQYKAEIIDFVQNQEDLATKKWNEKKIQGFKPNFNEYINDNKSAKILFLVSSFEKITPVPLSSFKFQKPYAAPTQHNLVPVISEPDNKIFTMQFDNISKKVNDVNEAALNQILYGPPGTGKTYHTINKALEIIGESIVGKTRKEIKELFDIKMKDGQVVFTTFHQSMSYEDFIEGIKPLKPLDNSSTVQYDIIDGIFKRLCRKAETPPNPSFSSAYRKLLKELGNIGEINLKYNNDSFTILMADNGEDLEVKSTSYIKNITKEGLEYVSKSRRFIGKWGIYYRAIFQYLKDKFEYKENSITETINHVLIIDEINRGNISQIFGELITLIEEDKRLGKEEALEVMLPYSKEKFGVPSNLYIIGTMNTADRSVEALDAALRRRFSFEEMVPKYDLEQLQYEFAGINVSTILKTINNRIEKILDKDHAIGHSYFMLRPGETPEMKIPNAFYKNIIPLLQEYFFGDYGKIGMVLGNGFVQKNDWDKNDDSFADFDSDSSSDFDDREVFEIIDYTNAMTDYQIDINKQSVQMDFNKAIRLLMKQQID